MILNPSTLAPRLRRNVLGSLPRVVWGVVIVCGLVGAIAEAPEVGSLEYEVKADFLVKFSRFVEWSSNAPVAGAKEGYTIGIQDPFGKFLR